MKTIRLEGYIGVEEDVYEELVRRGHVLGEDESRLGEFVSNTLVNKVDELMPDLEVDSGSFYFNVDDSFTYDLGSKILERKLAKR